MAQTDKPLEKIVTSPEEQAKYAEEVADHEQKSYSHFSNIRSTWDDKESMLIGSKPQDKLSKVAKSKISVPDLSTMVVERASRVMAQPASGEAFAVSKDDVGKNILMNLLIKYFKKNANEEGSHLLKMRQLNVYSHVYGSMFGLVPWRVNRSNGYIGPELLPINMRDARPQPGKRTIDKSDYFGVRSVASIMWLEKQDGDVWNMPAIAELKADLIKAKSGGESGKAPSRDNQSFVERDRYPSVQADEVFPDVELFTEYRNELWITIASAVKGVEGSKSRCLRVVRNAYPKGMLPIVAKHAFPLLDSLIGLGDFEKGKTLQFAKNSLVNLYMDGVKLAIFPPLHINLQNVDPASIKWGAGEKWYMKMPNGDVQVMNLKTTEWLNTFQSTYGFLSSAIQNLSGSTNVSSAQGSEPSLGKTPEAIQNYGMSQSARDEWDRFMQEDLCQQVYDRWVALIPQKLDVPFTTRIFGPEIKDIQKVYPEEKILDVFKSGSRGNLTIDKKLLNDKDLKEGEYTKYDFEIESGSTLQKANADEGQAASDMIKDFIAAPNLLGEIQKRGKDVDFAELYKRRMIGNGIKDWDKVLIDMNTGEGQMLDENGNVIQTPPEVAAQDATGNVQPPGATVPVAPTPGAPQSAPVVNPQPSPEVGAIQDPAIAQVLDQVMGGVSGIPPAA